MCSLIAELCWFISNTRKFSAPVVDLCCYYIFSAIINPQNIKDEKKQIIITGLCPDGVCELQASCAGQLQFGF
jgi:hypothetical protein